MWDAPAGTSGTGGERQFRIGHEGACRQSPRVPKARCWLRSEMPTLIPRGTGVRFPPPPHNEQGPIGSLFTLVLRQAESHERIGPILAEGVCNGLVCELAACRVDPTDQLRPGAECVAEPECQGAHIGERCI